MSIAENTTDEELIAAAFKGEILFGDSFDDEQIVQWYKDEEEAYANLGAKNRDEYRYPYHALNSFHSFRHLKGRKFQHALGIGSAYCDELIPIAPAIEQITVLEPSSAFDDVSSVHDVPCNYVKPDPSGVMPFESNEFDLTTCFGVLHHIPNVSFVVGEIFRTLKPGGLFLVREPIVSMGDWRSPRPGLTSRERGIPLSIFKDIVAKTGFEVQILHPCMFQPLPKIAAKFVSGPFNSNFWTRLDSILSALSTWNYRYHRRKFLEKFAPSSVFAVLKKPQ